MEGIIITSKKMSQLTTTRLLPLDIEEPLQSIIVENGARAVFECKITGNPDPLVTWSKDGITIKPSRRIKISSDKCYHRLEIRPVSLSDHAVYTTTFTSSTGQVSTEAVLHVAPNTDVHKHGGVLYVPTSPRNSLKVNKQLFEIKLRAGERANLFAQFASKAEEFVWYKSNKLVSVDQRISISNRKDSSELSINKVQLTDTGVYLVMAKTKYGIASSCSYVCVIDNDTIVDTNVPFIEEELRDEIEVSENDEVKLLCKCEYNGSTHIEWMKNGIQIGDDNIYVEEEYGNKYLGLKITAAHATDSALFSVSLKDDRTGLQDTSQCYLTVNECPLKKLPKVNLRKSVESVMACVGSEVCFDCWFGAEDYRYFYVVWHVGHYRIERTNSKFDVVNKDGEFLLRIKQVDIGMNGEVTCELRRALPNQKSILITTSSGNLTIVPQSVIVEFEDKVLNISTRHYRDRSKRPSRIRHCPKVDTNNKHFTWYNNDPKLTANGHDKEKQELRQERDLEIDFCKLEDEGFCYLNETSNEDEALSKIAVYRLDDDVTQPHLSDVVMLEWSESIGSVNKWYAIDLRQASGQYIELGLTSAPLIKIKDPPVGKTIRLKITAINAPRNSTESTVCISPSPDQSQHNRLCELMSMERYEEEFKETGGSIGCGAFGSVVLVQDKHGKHFAAKLLKTRTQKKRDTALREFEMMRMLKHPKLVELNASFSTKDTFILVMDYLWGGELLDRIVEEEYIKEADVVPYVRQISEGLEYLHSQKIAHLDLKPENIICRSPNSLQIKIIDFGLARILDDEHLTRAIYGTRDYVAPEVLNFERLTLACDMWSLGVVTYMLLSGIMPFAGDTWPERSANITMANYNYKDPAFKEISDLAKEFVDELLVLEANKRMSAANALSHQWIKEGPPRGAKAGHMKKTRENLKSYLANYRARWQRAGNVMIAAHRLRTQAGNHRNNDLVPSTALIKSDV